MKIRRTKSERERGKKSRQKESKCKRESLYG